MRETARRLGGGRDLAEILERARDGALMARRSLLRTRRRVVSRGLRGAIHAFSDAARRTPFAKPHRHRVEVVRNIPYRDTWQACHRLDVFRPTALPPPWPVVLYAHGGGFTMLSKDTHWLMGLMFARHGYLVFNINYRLAPKHPYPAALEDACEAFAWVSRHAGDYGGDLDRLVLSGESAGANLVTALTLASCCERPEPFARRVWEQGVVPRAVVPACGLLQVTDTERFAARNTGVRSLIGDRLAFVTGAYLRDHRHTADAALELADPLCLLERGVEPQRPLPPFFAPVGTKDPLIDDTRRLKRALDALGVACEPRYYDGGVHAFFVLIWQRRARRCWRDIFSFLSRWV